MAMDLQNFEISDYVREKILDRLKIFASKGKLR
jgi:hypothetical protein